jgi:hypothetical protein
LRAVVVAVEAVRVADGAAVVLAAEVVRVAAVEASGPDDVVASGDGD